MEIKFEPRSFGRRLKSMLGVDFRRMLTMPLFYSMVGICLVVPVLILVMTTMMEGSVPVNPQTGVETTVEGFKNTWQIIGTMSGEGSMLSMDITGMCNINLLYLFAAVFVCLFVSEDFRSGYAKNLFTLRAKKGDYIISKSLAGFFCGVCMVLAFSAGAMLGGAISGLSFDMGAADAKGIALCLLSKMLLMAVFVPLDLLMSVAAKNKAWLSMLGSLFASMQLFMMVPMLTPLNAGIGNVLMCLAGGVLFSAGLGVASGQVLSRTNCITG